ncbi:MiaB/RimO family radical SAM methylthiotransferase [Desulfarculales bacterium]
MVLLTCTVTATAGRQSRHLVRRLQRDHPGARVVVTGCDVQMAPLAYAREGLQVVERAQLAGLARRLDSVTGVGPAISPGQPLPSPDAGAFCLGYRQSQPGRIRGLLKVQDGCDAHCTYCIVPQTRGRPRSLPIRQARELWRQLGDGETAEVVLTGVHLGRYGQDLTPPADLLELVIALLAAHPVPRLRLSSLEVSEVNDGLLGLIAKEPRLCDHLHIPLQSGSDRLLQAMGRHYQAAIYAARVRNVAMALPWACLGTDVIVGMPGETDQDFALTEELIVSLPLAYLHVFPYSPRPGTPAATWPSRVAGPLAKARAARLRALSRQMRLAFLAGQEGRELEAVVEASGLARTGNYCLVRLDQPAPLGSLVRVRLGRQLPGRQEPLVAGRVL